MSAIAARLQTDTTTASRAGPVPWRRVSVSRDLQDVAEAWRRLESEGLATPYQRLDWIRAFAATVGEAHGLDLRYVTVSDGQDRIVTILPLEILRQHGARIARFIGDKHANYHMAVFDPGFAAGLDARQAQTLLRAVAAALGDVDALVFTNQPLHWQGTVNPFGLLAANQSPSHAYKLALTADCEGTLNRSMSTHARKKLKNKRNRLADFGASRLFRAETPEEIDVVLDAFLVQKAARFAQMGVADPFADPAMRAFLRAGAAPTGTQAGSAIELYGLEVAGELITTYVGAVHGGRFSGMATAYATGHATARTSPGEIMLVDLIKLKCREGFSVFDLGVGEARYKTTICDDRDDLVDTIIGITPAGRAMALLARLKRLAKRTVKRSPRLLRIAHSVSAYFNRSRPRSADGPAD